MRKNIINKLKENWFKLYLLISILFATWSYGMIVGIYHIFPFHIIQNAKLAAEDWIKDDNYKHYAKIRPEKFIFPSRYSGNGATINLINKTFDGYTLITSMWKDTSGFKLVDMDGTEIHNWRVSYKEIFPTTDMELGSEFVSDWDVNIHGSVIYPNGDIVFCFHGYGFVKIDKNSNVIWKLRENYHHSVYKDEYGNLWVPGRETVVDTVTNKFPLLRPPYYEDFICKISPDGVILKRTSLLDIFYQSGLEALLFADGTPKVEKLEIDFTHVNDIEVLDSKFADQYPKFGVGDIMVSMRQLNLIIIIDPVTYLIKWHMTGPYIRQHDPDFTPGGDIIVFDNRTDNSNGEILGGSRILTIDPQDRTVNIAYQGDSENKFYTEIAGKQMLLPNGNILIVEYGAGRVFEVTDIGEIVWTFINRYDEDGVYSITDAKRIPKKYFTFLK